jgi:hypothetical protein
MTTPYYPVLGGYNPTLPNFNDDDLDKQIEAISIADSNIFKQIAMLTHESSWQEKMALALNAIVAIDDSHTQLCVVQPKHGRYNENLAAAIGLLRHLSPGAKADLAVDILSDDWELGTVENAPSTLIEDGSSSSPSEDVSKKAMRLYQFCSKCVESDNFAGFIQEIQHILKGNEIPTSVGNEYDACFDDDDAEYIDPYYGDEYDRIHEHGEEPEDLPC